MLLGNTITQNNPAVLHAGEGIPFTAGWYCDEDSDQSASVPRVPHTGGANLLDPVKVLGINNTAYPSGGGFWISGATERLAAAYNTVPDIMPGTGSISVCFWHYPYSAQASDAMLCGFNNRAGVFAAGGTGWQIRRDGSNWTHKVLVATPGQGLFTQVCEATPGHSAVHQYGFILNREAKTLACFSDGVIDSSPLDITALSAGSLNPDAYGLSFGGGYTTGSALKGGFSDLLIYVGAWSAANITALWNGGDGVYPMV